ncbi:chemotaxis protein [Photobacterium sp. SDRW27]|uniref:chemotaxis protein n=1 Tax=Photobacterium obscurum TaxID=2829490 RepID=UPI0022445256|nr:chemotaxis protein [Photobacterium obscurum]MCW8330874.1 chemotaxis protein [Photobacterium obscurum]
MGKGGSSSSTNQNTSVNTSGQNAIQGDNLGVALSGINDSEIDVTMTDHGAMERAAELSELAITNNTAVTTEALDANVAVSEAALESNTAATEAALVMGENAVDSAMDFGRDALASNTAVLSESLEFGRDAMTANAEVANNAMEVVTNAHGENLQMMAGLAGNQAAQNSESLEAIKDLAAMKVDGGQVATSKQMTIIVGIVFFFVTVMMFKGKG